MSVQPSLLISTRLLSSQIVEHDSAPNSAANSNDTVLTDLFATQELLLTPESIQALSLQTSQAKQALKQLEEKLSNPEAENTNDIESLQNIILNDPDFDFSLLPSTAAGESQNDIGNTDQSSATDSFSGNAYVVQSSNESNTETPNTLQTISSNNSELSSKLTNQQNFSEAETDHTNKSLGTLNQSATEDLRFNVEGKIDTPYKLNAHNEQTEYGQFEYNNDGSWQYTLDNSADLIQSLGAQDSLVDSITLTSITGDTYTLNITIYGINDTAVISGDVQGEVSALSNNDPGVRPETIQGSLSVTDTDTDQAHMIAEQGIEGTFGTLDINENGDWIYSLNSESNAVKSLHASDSLYDLIPVRSVDGSNQLLKITIHGADDNPFLSGDNSETINLATELHAEQKLNIDDPDFGQSHFVAAQDIASRSNYGTGSIDEHGNWRFELNTDNPVIASLGENEFLFDTFTVESVDGTTQTIILKIEGSDQPLFANDTSSLSIDQLIAHDEHSEMQDTLDNFLGSSENNIQSSHTGIESTTSSSGEVLQQLQQNTTDHHHLT